MPRVLFLHTIPSPYRNPLFERLHQDSELDTMVFFMAKTAKNREWKQQQLNFPHKFLPELTITLKNADDLIPIWGSHTIPLEIIRGKFDVVVCSGWDSFGTFLARLTCYFLNIPMIVWAGSTKYEKSWRRTLMHWPVKILVKSCAALVSYGQASKEYLLSFGVPENKIIISYNSVDIDFFRKEAIGGIRQKQKMRQGLGIKNKVVLLFSGQLISRKGVFDLYDVVKKLSATLDIGVIWLGHGPLENKLKQQAKNDRLNNQYFMKTNTNAETAKIYALADFFVLPTYEDIFSNVVPEALAAGLPVITTRQNGVSIDYISEGKNGFIIDAGDTAALLQHVSSLAKNSTLRNKMASQTWDLVKNFNYNNNVSSFKRAINLALKQNA